jgi:hypothetical protein
MAPVARPMQFGIQDDNVLLNRYYGDPEAVLKRGKDLRAQLVRFIAPWGGIETAPGQYDWQKLDRAVKDARSHGYRVHMTLGGIPNAPPAWEGDKQHPNVAGYGNFVREAVKRYRGQVGDFGLYNEPDVSGVDPHTYRQLYIAGRRAALEQAPHARIYFGELSGAHPLQYTADALKGGRLHTEGFAWHPYQWQRAPENAGGRPESVGIGKIGALERFLQRHENQLSTARGQAPGMYATEFGYRTRGEYGISDRRAAAWWPRALKQAEKHGLRELIAYEMAPDNRPSDDGSGLVPWDSSLLGMTGPRPAFSAIARARAQRR